MTAAAVGAEPGAARTGSPRGAVPGAAPRGRGVASDHLRLTGRRLADSLSARLLTLRPSTATTARSGCGVANAPKAATSLRDVGRLNHANPP